MDMSPKKMYVSSLIAENYTIIINKTELTLNSQNERKQEKMLLFRDIIVVTLSYLY